MQATRREDESIRLELFHGPAKTNLTEEMDKRAKELGEEVVLRYPLEVYKTKKNRRHGKRK